MKVIRSIGVSRAVKAGLAGWAMLMLSTQASAQTSPEFYKGKSVDFYIGFNAGDTYDIYSRLASQHLGRFLPGNPTIVPRNMPGAGSLKVTNYMYAQGAKDGTAIGMTGQAVAFEQMVKNPAVQYDARQLTWIGRMAPVIQFIAAWHTAPVKSMDDVMKRETLLAATSPTGVTGTAPRMLNKLGGAKFKIIHGYQGVTGTMLAAERGETEAGTVTAQTLLFGRPEYLATPLVHVLVQYSKGRSHLFPNIPAMGEFGRTAEEKEILQLYGSTAELGRAIMAPPGLPAERVKALRDAFNSMMKDSQFLADAQRSKMELDPLDGISLQKIVNDTINVSPELSKAVAKAIEE